MASPSEITSSPFNFEKLQVYQDVLNWINQVYAITNQWPKDEQFGLIGQFRRAAISIALNISEGSGRTPKDFAHFLSIARGSCYECSAIITIAKGQGYTSQSDYEYHYDKCNKFARTLTSLRTKVIQSNNE